MNDEKGRHFAAPPLAGLAGAVVTPLLPGYAAPLYVSLRSEATKPEVPRQHDHISGCDMGIHHPPRPLTYEARIKMYHYIAQPTIGLQFRHEVSMQKNCATVPLSHCSNQSPSRAPRAATRGG